MEIRPYAYFVKPQTPDPNQVVIWRDYSRFVLLLGLCTSSWLYSKGMRRRAALVALATVACWDYLRMVSNSYKAKTARRLFVDDLPGAGEQFPPADPSTPFSAPPPTTRADAPSPQPPIRPDWDLGKHQVGQKRYQLWYREEGHLVEALCEGEPSVTFWIDEDRYKGPDELEGLLREQAAEHLGLSATPHPVLSSLLPEQAAEHLGLSATPHPVLSSLRPKRTSDHAYIVTYSGYDFWFLHCDGKQWVVAYDHNGLLSQGPPIAAFNTDSQDYHGPARLRKKISKVARDWQCHRG